MNLIDMVQADPALSALWPKLKTGRHLVTGLSGSAKTVFFGALLQQRPQQILIVENNRFHADELAADLSSLLGDAMVYDFPVEDVLAAEVAVSSPETRNDRINALTFIQSGKPGIIVTSLAGYKRLLPSPADWAASELAIDMTSELDPQTVAKQLVAMGYRRDSLVSAPGQFAIRGGIIDVYPLNQDDPIRIELFDTEIDSIRSFDIATQRSLQKLQQITIAPATDMVATDQVLAAAGERITKQANAYKAKVKNAAAKQAVTDGLLTTGQQLSAHERPENLALYAAELYPEQQRISDYLQPDALVAFDDYSRLLDSDTTLVQDTAEWYSQLQEEGRLLPNTPNLTIQELAQQDKRPRLYLSLFQKGMGQLRLDSLTNIPSRNVQQFFSQMPLLKTETDRWVKQQTVVFLITDKNRLEKLSETLSDFEISNVMTAPTKLLPSQVQLTEGSLKNGFELPDLKLVVVTEHELFNARQRRHARHQTLANTERLRSYNELKPGDYVVHVNHGIGQYTGMETLEVDGVHRDYITIVYRNNDKLFIPVDQLNLVQKYVSADGKTPSVNKLGGAEWQKTKRKVAARIEDIADELIDLYAKREAEKGFAFGPDDDLQHKFEAEFPYPETPDQLRSAKEIKHDMEKPKPMDRLLVGDVGFGKTEVALRAAFKAIDYGKQAAILVPTTILAQQHFDTMKERFADFPIKVGLLSRFQTAHQNKETIKGLKNGTIDIVVGTHRLLSKDVAFRDLGLLVIDEEQRFGVKHKERIKQLKSNVDVLTLTATPIPRTLNMSMLGVRDLSVIETPPTNRYPIQTFVMEQNPGVIREAIEREMERGGQVFYLHNRVEDMERTVSQLEELVPDASVGYAHGQMTETQLENVIYDFLHGAYDVLVTTTIIETGVDMPNANTLIIENADHYGLSQLYQLRGRIGRSSRVAYAYFMYQPMKVLNEVAEKRLQAIKDFTELGSGFKIAMRDLSIRGAGNLLGKQQHGFIDSVGYDLYTQMLQEAVNKRRGIKSAEKTDAEIDLGLEAYLPTDYVADSRQKIELYKRIREADSDEAETEISEDLIDRFGDYPQPVTNLLAIAHLKRFADLAWVNHVTKAGQKLTVVLSSQATAKAQGEPIFKALSATTLKAQVAITDGKLTVTLALPKDMKTATWLDQLTGFLQGLLTVVNPQPEKKSA
ncbi:transcription-repair coupling factor [Lacticaseibacillus paracasei]|uniref:transcription-repair coupling factor n=1 Tax=Lacticaseibacillus paracasei TaxID=1597 RepID=UPI0031F67753